MHDKQVRDLEWLYGGFLRHNGMHQERISALWTAHNPLFKILLDYHARPTRDDPVTFPLPAKEETEEIAARLLPVISELTGEKAERLVPISASRPIPRPEWMSDGGYVAAMRAALGESLGTSLMSAVLPQFRNGSTDDDHERRANLYEAQRRCLGGPGNGTSGLFSLILEASNWGHGLNTRLVLQCAQSLNRSLFHHIALTLEGRHDEAALFEKLLTQPYTPIAGRLISGRHKPRPNVPGAWYILVR